MIPAARAVNQTGVTVAAVALTRPRPRGSRPRGRRRRRATRWSAAVAGPASSAALARTSASSAVGAFAVTCTTPVQAGPPVAGSSRWCARRPSVAQARRVTPLVATPQPPWRSSSATAPAPIGSATATRRERLVARPPRRRSPQQSTATRARWPSRPATSSAARPLPSPPESRRTPGGRRTAPRARSATTRPQRRCGSGPAGRRGGSPAAPVAPAAGAGPPPRTRLKVRAYPARSSARSWVASTRPPLSAPAQGTASARSSSMGEAGRTCGRRG